MATNPLASSRRYPSVNVAPFQFASRLIYNRIEMVCSLWRRADPSETNPMSDLALQRIAENRRSGATFLDLGNCGLTEVPAQVGELVWLESLSLASEWYEWDGRAWQSKKSRNTGDKNHHLIPIRPLLRLTRLRPLTASYTLLTHLTPL